MRPSQKTRIAFGLLVSLGLAAVAGGLVLPALVSADGLAAQRAAIERVHPDVAWVDTATLARWLTGPEARRPVLLDAREEAEFEVSHLAGARRVDPAAVTFEGLGLRRDRRVVVYCSVGWRSGAIAERLRAAGYTAAYNLEGGIFQWANEGRRLRRRAAGGGAAEDADRVHPYDATWGLMLDPERRAPVR